MPTRTSCTANATATHATVMATPRRRSFRTRATARVSHDGGNTLCSAASATTATHSQRGAPGSWKVNTSVTSDAPPTSGPHSRAMASVMTTTRNSSNSVHERTQVLSTSSTPEACNRRKPGGRCNSSVTLWKSWAHDTAGNEPPPSMRLSALTRRFGERTSTPLSPLLAVVVMNASPGPSPVEARPRVVPLPITRRSPVKRPPSSSWTV